MDKTHPILKGTGARLKKWTPKNKSQWINFRLEVLSEEFNLKGELRCSYCYKKISLSTRHTWSRATLDHLVPMSRGGDRYDRANVVISCRLCNQLKGEMPLEEWQQDLHYLFSIGYSRRKVKASLFSFYDKKRKEHRTVNQEDADHENPSLGH